MNYNAWNNLWYFVFGLLQRLELTAFAVSYFLSPAMCLESYLHYVSGPRVRLALLATLLAPIESTVSPISHYTFFTAPEITRYIRNERKAKNARHKV